MCVCGVCVSSLFISWKMIDLRCLFSPHQVNHGGVQKAPAQVSLYKSHTTEEPLRRRRSGRYCQVLSSHSGQVGKLLLMLLPPHQRVCNVTTVVCSCPDHCTSSEVEAAQLSPLCSWPFGSTSTPVPILIVVLRFPVSRLHFFS